MALNLSLLDPAPVFAISGFGLPERALAWIVIAWGLVASVPLLVSLRKLAYKKLYFNPRWWRQNLRFALSSRDDFQLASRYGMRVLKVVRDYRRGKYAQL